MKSENLIKELQKLTELNDFEFDEIGEIVNNFKYEPIKFMLKSLQIGSKPEDSTSKLLQSVFSKILSKKNGVFTEVKLISGGFADYRIYENKVNPIVIELKPLFYRVLTKNKTKKLKLKKLKYQNYKKQVQKYLKDNEYVILTNLNEAILFNRDAILDYEPFYELKFTDLLTQFLTIDNLWDTIRKLDDNLVKPELERHFFLDLKKWYHNFDGVAFELKNGLQKEELIVLFLNKIIFIKTLEDYGLIPYKFLEDLYFKKKRDWETKGVKKTFDNFFGELEDWFYSYYDTELFTIKVWDYIFKDVMTQENETEPKLEHFQLIFEKILGFGRWEYSFGKGMIHYNYRKIDEDIFGKAYETFIAESRKDSGIFYTPKDITQYVVETTINQLFEPFIQKITEAIKSEDIAKARELFTEMQKIKITDTSSGSGSFLIKALREIYKHYEKLEEPTDWVRDFKKEGVFANTPRIVTDTIKFREETNIHHGKEYKRNLLANIILNHIFATDIDERAIETAKTNIWKEAVKLNPPIYNYHGLPKSVNHILPNLQMNFMSADALYDLTIKKQIKTISENCKRQIIELHDIRNKYISNHNEPKVLEPVKNLKKTIRNRLTEEIAIYFIDKNFFDNLEKEGIDTKIIKKLKPLENKKFRNKGKFLLEIDKILEKENNSIYEKIFIKSAKKNTLSKPTFIVADYFFNYFDKNGNTLPEDQQGFDAIISNPPWEASKPVKKEFAKIDKLNMDVLDFNKWFAKNLKKDTDFNKNWNNYKNFYTLYNVAMRERYFKQGVGDTNLYKLFVERDFQLVKKSGYVSLLIPSGIQTDKGCSELRKLIIKDNKLSELYSFENRGYYKKASDESKTKLFPEVDNRFKFTIVLAKKENYQGLNYKFKSKFYMQHPNELYKKSPIIIDAMAIKNFSKDNFSIMEFRTQIDNDLCVKIRGKHKFLKDTNYRLRTEFHMTNDSNLFSKTFNKKKSTNKLFLYEGKMIHQYNSNYNDAKYFVDKKEAIDNLISKEIYRIKKATKLETKEITEFVKKDNLLLDFQTYRLVHRAIASSTNERTLIATIIPKNVFIGNSLNHFVNFSYEQKGDKIVQNQLKLEDLLLYQTLFNSLTVNYYLRNKVSANLNMFYLYELPIPEVSEKEKHVLIEKSYQLLCANSSKKQFAELGQKTGIKIREIDYITERAEIEIIIAKNIYSLSKKDWKYLTSTFIYGKSETKEKLDEIIKKSIENWNS